METISDYATTFLLNAAWQIAVIAVVAAACARPMRRAPARYQHLLWVAALVASLGLPAWSSYDLHPIVTDSSGNNTIRHGLTEVLPSPARSIETHTIAVAAGERIEALVGHASSRTQPHTVSYATILTWIVLSLYLLFVAYRGFGLWRAWRHTGRLRRASELRALTAPVQAAAAHCRTALQLGEVDVLFSRQVISPAVIGARRPAIILPADLPDDCSREMLLATFGHEMAHVRRGDYAFNLIYELLFLCVSFHPGAVWMKRQINRTRELACDELVAARVLQPEVYARSLLRLAASLTCTKERGLALGIFDTNILEERIMTIVKTDNRIGARVAASMLLIAITLIAATGIAASTFSFSPRMNLASRQSQEVQDGAAAQTDVTKLTDVTKEIAALGSVEPMVRGTAAGELGKRRAAVAIPYLIGLLGDDAVITPVEVWRSERRWSPAIKTFEQPSPGEEAALALASIGEASLEPLVVALRDSNSSVRRNAAWAIGELRGGPAVDREIAVESLIALLPDADAGVRRAAAEFGKLKWLTSAA